MSRRRRQKQMRLAIMNIVAAVAIVALAAYAMMSIQPPEYDEMTLCFEDVDTPPHTAIILDKTDEYSVEEAEFIAALIRRESDRLDVGERLTLFELDERGEFNPRGEFSLCNPGRGSQVNPLFQNPEKIEERYTELFEAPLQDVLDDLVTPKEAPASPILEAIARLSQTENFSRDVDDRRLVVVSDMLQNSDIFSAYSSQPLPDSGDISIMVEDRFGDELRGVDLEVRLIPRKGRADQQRGELRDFWDDVLSDLGVDTRWRDL